MLIFTTGDDGEKKVKAKKKKAPPQTPPPTPPRSPTEDQREKNLKVLFKDLNIVEKVIMLPYHTYSWMEAVSEDDIALGTNLRLKRITCDILLCGPTSIDQVQAAVSLDRMCLLRLL
jgi:hypothetical protein